jgi:transposase
MNHDSDPKLAALKESGTLNPQADRVTDAAFVAGGFFDPRDLVQVRYEMLRQVHMDEQAVATVADNFGVSRPTFYKVQADFQRAGLAGLLPVKRGPHGPHKISGEVLEFIEDTARQDSHVDVLALIAQINQRFGLLVHRRTVERALSRLKKNRDARASRSARQPPVPDGGL